MHGSINIKALSDFPNNQEGKHSDSRNTARQGQTLSISHFRFTYHRIITVPSFVLDKYNSYRKHRLLVDVTDFFYYLATLL